jgi:hypothetical protein
MSEGKKSFYSLLENLADSIDISETQHKKAEAHYMSVGQWLAKEDSPLAPYNPDIYPQGSFRLGTVVKPITDQDEYDIDLVCQLNLSKKDIIQAELKQLVGDRLKESKTYKQMLDEKEGRRCWILNYADGGNFHMDILPSIPDIDSIKSLELSRIPHELAKHAIYLTDKTSLNYKLYDSNWPCSNPKGYAEWFKEQMKVQFDLRRKMIADSMFAKIDTVPEYRVKTTLQRSIQLLKRHRDIAFINDQDNKPISIIITTLAALSYKNEADLYEALTSIVKGMPNHINMLNNVAWIQNPVNPKENFADKWQGNPQKELNLRKWLLKVQADLDLALTEENSFRRSDVLKKSFGIIAVNKAFSITTGVKLNDNLTKVEKSPEIIIRNPAKPWQK